MSSIISYLYWHYTKAFVNIWGIFSNFIWATYRFFSISLLLRTFFYPWHHLDDSYTKRFDLEQFFNTFIVNTLMRLVGMFVKFFVLLGGIICLLAVIVIEVFSFLIWIALPGIIVWFFGMGILKVINAYGL